MDELVSRFLDGEDISYYLSKRAHKPSEFDELLYDWGIYHFHLGQTIDSSGFISRTGPILFARLDDNYVYCINIFCHGRGVAPPWNKQEMIEIIHENWPNSIASHKIECDGILWPDNEPPTDEEHAMYRKNHLNIPVETADGTIYHSPGLGYMASGHSIEIQQTCKRIWNTLKMVEMKILTNLPSYISAVQAKMGALSLGTNVSFRLVFCNGEFFVIEAKSSSRLIKVNI